MNDDIAELLIQAKELGLLDESHGFRNFARILPHDAFHEVARPWAEQMVKQAQQEHAFIPFVSPKHMKGNIFHGHGIYCLIRTILSFYYSHVLFVGNSGAGKSVHQRCISPQLASQPNIRTWIFVYSKNEEEQLYHHFQDYNQHLVVLRADDLIDNLFDPPGTTFKQWLPRCLEILNQLLETLSDAGKDFVLRTILTSKEIPTFETLLAKLEEQTDVHPQTKASVIRPLRSLLQELPESLKSYRRGYSIKELASTHCLFLLHGNSQRLQTLVTLTLISKLYEYSVRHEKPFRNIIVMEEAYRFLKDDNSLIAWLYTQVRGVKVHFISYVQQANIARTVLANSAMKILGRSYWQDIQSFGSAIGLDRKQMEFVHGLNPGEFIMQLPGRKPFPFKGILVEDKPGLTSAEIRQTQDILDKSVLEQVSDTSSHGTEIRCLPSPQETLSEQQVQFLVTIHENQLLPVTQFSNLLNISRRKAIKLRKQLIAKGLVKEEFLDAGTRGGRTIILTLTPRGLRILESYR